MIFTIGYGNLQPDIFIKALQAYRIEYLIDIRSYPYAWHSSYNKDNLEKILKTYGIIYKHVSILGGKPSNRAFYIDGYVSYRLMAADPELQQVCERLRAFAETHRVCLMCCELNPDHCHRYHLLDRLLPLVHLPYCDSEYRDKSLKRYFF